MEIVGDAGQNILNYENALRKKKELKAVEQWGRGGGM